MCPMSTVFTVLPTLITSWNPAPWHRPWKYSHQYESINGIIVLSCMTHFLVHVAIHLSIITPCTCWNVNPLHRYCTPVLTMIKLEEFDRDIQWRRDWNGPSIICPCLSISALHSHMELVISPNICTLLHILSPLFAHASSHHFGWLSTTGLHSCLIFLEFLQLRHDPFLFAARLRRDQKLGFTK